MIAFICPPLELNPLFNHFCEVFYYLSKIDQNIILYLDNNENELNDFQKKMIKGLNVKYIKDLNDDQLFFMMVEDNIDILVSMYGHYKRKDILLKN